MKNYAGNKKLLTVIQTFFLIFIGFISTSIWLSTFATTETNMLVQGQNTTSIK